MKIIAILLLVGSVAMGQNHHPLEPRVEMELGSVTVWLGMNQDEALNDFRQAGYQIGPGSTEVSKIVMNGKNAYSVWFIKGQLSFAERDWYSGGDVMKAVMGVVGQMAPDRDQTCTISHQPFSKPGFSADRILIFCDLRSVELIDGIINLGDGKQSDLVEVKERIGFR